MASESLDSAGVQATQNQIGTQDQRTRANASFGAFLENDLESTVQASLGLTGPNSTSRVLTASIKRTVRASVGGALGVQGGIAAGGVGGTAGGGADIKLSSSLSIGAKATFGAGAAAGAGVSASLAGGTTGNVSGVPTGPSSLGTKLGGRPTLVARFGLGIGGVQSSTSVDPRTSANLKRGVSASVMAALKVSMAGAGFAPSQIDDMNSRLQPVVTDSVARPVDSTFGPELEYPHADGVPILSFRIVMQQRGKWTATYRLDQADDDSEPPTGPFAADINGVEYHGTIVQDRSGSWAGAHKIRVVGGAGGLDVVYETRNYAKQVVLFSTVFNDILRDSGEVASEECDPEILNQSFPSWHRVKGTASQSLSMLCDKTGCEWRVLRDGTIWVGKDTWPEIEPSGTVMHEIHDEGIVKVQPDYATLVPGVIVRGHKIQKVVHSMDDHDANASLRSDCYANSEQSMFNKILDKANHRTTYYGRYPCEVTQQNSDGTLQVMPEDDEIRGDGLDNCEIYVGLPGTVLKVPKGARCLVAFRAGDPSRAYVDGWLQGTQFTSIDIG